MSLSTWFFVFLPVSCLVLVHLTFFSGTGALHPFSWHVHTTWAFSLWSSWCYFYWSSHMFLCHLCYFYWSSHMFFVTGATSTDPLTCSFVTCATSTDPLTCSLSLVLLLLILSHVLCHWCYFYWSSHMFLCHLCYFYWSSHMFFVTGATSTDPLTCSLSLVLLLLILSHVRFWFYPRIHRSILISFTSSLFSWHFIVDHGILRYTMSLFTLGNSKSMCYVHSVAKSTWKHSTILQSGRMNSGVILNLADKFDNERINER